MLCEAVSEHLLVREPWFHGKFERNLVLLGCNNATVSCMSLCKRNGLLCYVVKTRRCAM